MTAPAQIMAAKIALIANCLLPAEQAQNNSSVPAKRPYKLLAHLPRAFPLLPTRGKPHKAARRVAQQIIRKIFTKLNIPAFWRGFGGGPVFRIYGFILILLFQALSKQGFSPRDAGLRDSNRFCFFAMFQTAGRTGAGAMAKAVNRLPQTF